MPGTILDKVDIVVNKLIRLPALIELSVEGENDIIVINAKRKNYTANTRVSGMGGLICIMKWPFHGLEFCNTICSNSDL